MPQSAKTNLAEESQPLQSLGFDFFVVPGCDLRSPFHDSQRNKHGNEGRYTFMIRRMPFSTDVTFSISADLSKK
jgi:gamma-glutamyl:cysteine ligase YbdK (ATP-grasp superfamily)